MSVEFLAVPERLGSRPAMQGSVSLSSDALKVVLDPARGGAIREFSWQEFPVFRPTPVDANDDPFSFSCFPMVPYANRVAEGRFTFEASEVRLDPNWVGDPNPLHGQGWRAPWSIVDASSSSALLRFEGGDDDWPWRYRAEQRFNLYRDTLTITLALENRSDRRMPAMLGLHPYFPNMAKACLRATLPRVWVTEHNIPTEEVPTPAAWRFDTGRWADAVPLDHCFSGWDGVARVAWADRSIFVRATNCPCLHVYSPPGSGFFCIEPQTAPAGALNRNEAASLAPRDRLAIQVSFTVGAL